MKYIFLILTLITFSCKSQTISLERRAECDIDPDNCPEFNYIKDNNNTLDKYIGVWKGNYEGKTYEIQLKKGIYQDITLSDLKRDRLIGRLRISTAGQLSLIEYDTFIEIDDSKTRFQGLGLASNLQHYMMHFGAPSPEGCMDRGTVYLTIKSSTPNTMNIFYGSDTGIVEGECPSSFKQTFPEQKNIYLTRQ